MRRPARIAVAALALVAVLLLGRAAVSWFAPPAGSVRVERGSLVVGVEVTGTLRAVETSALGPPQVPDLWQFKIAMMAAEGQEVEEGQPILAFDVSELQQRLQSKQADLDAATTELEKMRVDVEATVANDTLALAEVEARLRRARLLAERPSDLYSNLDLDKAKLDLELAELEVELVRSRIEATRRAGAEELRVLETIRAQVLSQVRQIEDAIGRMTRTAPRDGIVIHITNWRNEKKKVGDSCWVAEQVLEIPDLRQMKADAEVEEARAGRVREGQKVALRLDAHPDREYRGTVQSISRAVQEKSWRNPLKVVHLRLSLDETDPERMRPGMRFRGEIEIERREDVVLLPVDAVFHDRGAPVAYRRTAAGWRPVPLSLGDRSGERVEVLDGVEPGDLVAVERPR